MPERDPTGYTLGYKGSRIARARRMKEMAAPERIQIDPKVMLGKPVIRGTPITVELLLRKLGEGASEADLLDAYPQLTRDDLQAAMTYAAIRSPTKRT